ncbi:hypothetical protein BU23DRAFT_568107 [Bimuria novae-zelandiae CBS 107.79]|uniref:Uncharacterized protein n=1 Tax=Bimuria novae-zelandiae CBS 107.79 TaxID=1447943 RepID=A0A6A5VAJ0_9PLEO|nr:hypothetical protein BU23DRAFT_568107 [Bimuria novae-zelandiae CBS 107.79]
MSHTGGIRCSASGCQFPPFKSTQALRKHTLKYHVPDLDWRPIRRMRKQEFHPHETFRLGSAEVTATRQATSTGQKQSNGGFSNPTTNSTQGAALESQAMDLNAGNALERQTVVLEPAVPSARAVWEALQPDGLAFSDLVNMFPRCRDYVTVFNETVVSVAFLDGNRSWLIPLSKIPPDEQPVGEQPPRTASALRAASQQAFGPPSADESRGPRQVDSRGDMNDSSTTNPDQTAVAVTEAAGAPVMTPISSLLYFTCCSCNQYSATRHSVRTCIWCDHLVCQKCPQINQIASPIRKPWSTQEAEQMRTPQTSLATQRDPQNNLLSEQHDTMASIENPVTDSQAVHAADDRLDPHLAPSIHATSRKSSYNPQFHEAHATGTGYDSAPQSNKTVNPSVAVKYDSADVTSSKSNRPSSREEYEEIMRAVSEENAKSMFRALRADSRQRSRYV